MFFGRKKKKTPSGFATFDFPDSRRKKRKIKLKIGLPKFKINWWIWFCGLIIILLLGGLAYLFIWSPVFKIGEIKISGTNFVPEKQVRQRIDSLLQGKIFRFIPQNSIFIFPEGRFKKNILADFPEIESINIKRFPPKRMEVSLVERAMAAVWCQSRAETEPSVAEPAVKSEAASSTVVSERLNLPQSEQCYFADKNGIIFREAPEISGTMMSTFYGQPGQVVALASQAISSSTIQFADQVKKQAREAGVDISGFLTGEPGGTDLSAVTQEGWTIYLDESRSPVVQLKVLQTLLDSEIKDKRASLNYVDLRTVNRVYYK